MSKQMFDSLVDALVGVAEDMGPSCLIEYRVQAILIKYGISPDENSDVTVSE